MRGKEARKAFLPLFFITGPTLTSQTYYMTVQETESEPANFIRFCPHCGSGRFVALSGGEFKCEECGFDFFVNSAAAVVAVITDGEGRLLLTRRARNPFKGWLDLPGGFVAPGESAETALAREVREELNVMVTGARFLYSFPNEYVYSGYKVRTTDLAFLCTTDTKPETCDDDVESIIWLSPSEVNMDVVAFSSIRNILAKVKEDRPSLWH